MQKVVVDSSVMVKWINRENEQNLDKSDKILLDVESRKTTVFAPELAKYEVGNTLLKKGLETYQAFHSLGTVYGLPIQFVSETETLALETYEMAKEIRSSGNTKFTYYDASFAAVAKQEDATLVTDNPKHQAKIKGVRVIALKDYK